MSTFQIKKAKCLNCGDLLILDTPKQHKTCKCFRFWSKVVDSIKNDLTEDDMLEMQSLLDSCHGIYLKDNGGGYNNYMDWESYEE